MYYNKLNIKAQTQHHYINKLPFLDWEETENWDLKKFRLRMMNAEKPKENNKPDKMNGENQTHECVQNSSSVKHEWTSQISFIADD